VAGATGAAVGEAVACAIGDGEVAGLALPAGKTPAPEPGAGEETGEGEACAAVADGEAWVAPCDFMSSRRRALSPAVLLWA